MITYDGLTVGVCEHERSEFIENRWGSDWRRCLGCGETLEIYQDCLGG